MFAVFVFSIGLLGIAALQLTAQQSNYDAVQRTTASMLANDIIERMRANNGSLGNYVSTSWTPPTTTETEPTPTCSGSGNSCASAELAAHDLWQWHQQVAGAAEISSSAANVGGLVSPTVCITQNGTGYDVAIAWYGKTALSNPTASNCGAGAGRYGTNDAYRRLVIVSTYIE